MISRRGYILAGGSAVALGAAGYGLWPRVAPFEAAAKQLRRDLETDADVPELLRFATLAANSHNTQPWRFRLSAGSVDILPDLARATPVVDPENRHLFASLGCATENLALAARARGRGGEVEIGAGDAPAITVSLESGAAEAGPLFGAIPLRQSTRSEYDGNAVPAAEIKLLEAAARLPGVAVQVFTSAEDRTALTELVIAANSGQMEDPAFHEELLDWLRFSPDRALETRDGLFSGCSGNPAMPEWLGRRMFGLVFKAAAENDKYRRQIASSAGVAVFTGDEDSPAGWVRAGRSFQRFALQATALGIRTAHVNQPIERPDVLPDLARWLGMPGRRPNLVVRFGYAPAMPMSLRRRVVDLVV